MILLKFNRSTRFIWLYNISKHVTEKNYKVGGECLFRNISGGKIKEMEKYNLLYKSDFSSMLKLRPVDESNPQCRRSISMDYDKLQVPMEMFKENREKLKKRLLDNREAKNGLILLRGGDTINHYNTDMEYVFRQESFFIWMFGVLDPGYYGAYDMKTYKTYLFLPRLPEEYAVWMGKLPTPASVAEKYMVDGAYYVDEIKTVLKNLGTEKLFVLSGVNTDSGLEFEEPHFEGISEFSVDNTTLYPEMVECRVRKSKMEIDILRYVSAISSEAHIMVMKTIEPGSFEYQSEATFQHYCYHIGGCRHMAYTSICGAGCNSSVLHYGHAACPNSKKIEDGEMCLFDMGASFYGYCSDITCSFPVNGKFTPKQAVIYNAVLRANESVKKYMRPGASWVDLHKLATNVLLEDLTAAKILVGDPQKMAEAGLGGTFFPHGLGHLLGLDVHDVGGYTKDTPPRPKGPGIKSLRTARTLEQGMVITVEPGCYFIDELLNQALASDKLKGFLNPEAIEAYRGFGGIRIEDVVLVTDIGIENFTKVPRTIEQIEELMETAKQSRGKKFERLEGKLY